VTHHIMKNNMGLILGLGGPHVVCGHYVVHAYLICTMGFVLRALQPLVY